MSCKNQHARESSRYIGARDPTLWRLSVRDDGQCSKKHAESRSAHHREIRACPDRQPDGVPWANMTTEAQITEKPFTKREFPIPGILNRSAFWHNLFVMAETVIIPLSFRLPSRRPSISFVPLWRILPM